jgi:predicted Rossmann fold nucleotide-binding protein DprA/Smf involved in DNA uptake
MPIKSIVSGGQTGVDRAGLDAAMAVGLEVGGWCPKGRQAEDGVIPEKYSLRETKTRSYAERTRLNVQDSDGTLILNTGSLEGGTKRTLELALQLGKPCLVLNIDEKPDNETFSAWVTKHNISVLNVAGPRESKRPGIQKGAAAFLSSLLEREPGT